MWVMMLSIFLFLMCCSVIHTHSWGKSLFKSFTQDFWGWVSFFYQLVEVLYISYVTRLCCCILMSRSFELLMKSNLSNSLFYVYCFLCPKKSLPTPKPWWCFFWKLYSLIFMFSSINQVRLTFAYCMNWGQLHFFTYGYLLLRNHLLKTLLSHWIALVTLLIFHDYLSMWIYF